MICFCSCGSAEDRMCSRSPAWLAGAPAAVAAAAAAACCGAGWLRAVGLNLTADLALAYR